MNTNIDHFILVVLCMQGNYVLAVVLLISLFFHKVVAFLDLCIKLTIGIHCTLCMTHFNTLDATHHLSGVRTYSPNAPRATEWRLEKATKILFEPEIVAVRDGLYC